MTETSDKAGFLAVMISASIVIGIAIILLGIDEIIKHNFTPLFFIILIIYWFILFITFYSILKLMDFLGNEYNNIWRNRQ
ncbi:MAG: hypothetical protein RXO36_03230 [Candidatus Nanopusillus acidilobi]